MKGGYAFCSVRLEPFCSILLFPASISSLQGSTFSISYDMMVAYPVLVGVGVDYLARVCGRIICYDVTIFCTIFTVHVTVIFLCAYFHDVRSTLDLFL